VEFNEIYVRRMAWGFVDAAREAGVDPSPRPSPPGGEG